MAITSPMAGGVLPFILAAPGDTPGSTLQAGQPAYATGADGKTVAVDTTTRTEQLTPSKHSEQSTEFEGEDAKKPRLQYQAASEAAKAALAQPMLPGYTIDPATGLEMKPPEPAPAPGPNMSTIEQPPQWTPIPPPAAAPVTHTRAEQEDVNARYVADQKAKQAEAAAAESVRIEKAKADAAANWMKDVESAKAELTKARKGLSDPGNKGFLNEVLQAFAQFAGAYSAGILGGPNHAANIIQAKQQRELEKKKIELEAATENMTRVGASRTQIDKVIDDQWARFIAKQKLDLESVQAKANNLLSRFPNAQAEANKTITQEAVKLDKGTAELAKGIGGRRVSSGQSTQGVQQTTVTPGTREGVGKEKVPTESEQKKADYGRRIIRAMDAVDASPELTDKDIRVMNNNVRALMNQAENSSKGLIGEAKIRAMQAVGWSPKSFTDGIPKEKIPAVLGYLEGSGVLIRNDSGAAVMNWEDARNAQVKLPQEGEGKKVWDLKKKNMREDGNALLALSGEVAQSRLRNAGSPPPAVQSAPAQPRPAAAPAPTPANLTGNEAKNLKGSDRTDYYDAIKVKPGDPDYAGAQAAIRKLAAKARGK